MRIKYFGAVYDPSGYAEFARGFVLALDRAGVDVVVQPQAFEAEKPNLGGVKKILDRLAAKPSTNIDVKIINCTPEFYEQFKEPHCKNIGFTMFETTRIPKVWVEACNKMDAIFVPCQWNVDVFKSSGVTVPVFSVPPGFDPKDYEIQNHKYEIDRSGIDYLFYSIFQWTPRKNPEGLLKTYWATFTGNDKVALLLKTYGADNSPKEQERIRTIIKELKHNQPLAHYPKVVLVNSLLSNEQIHALHAQGDCFVLPHRAEGFGMPLLSSMVHGKPCISTNFSGNLEFMNKDNSYLLDRFMTPVSDMWWCKWYEGDMWWAEPDRKQLSDYMLYVYNNRDEAARIGLAGKEFVYGEFAWEKRIGVMLDLLKKIV
jgi:glycosyltransferase involved in cell wall biosynthesis